MPVVRSVKVSELTTDMFLYAFFGYPKKRLLPILEVNRRRNGEAYAVSFLNYEGELACEVWASNQAFTVLAPDSSSE